MITKPYNVGGAAKGKEERIRLRLVVLGGQGC